MTDATSTPPEPEARDAWNDRLSRHSSALAEAAAVHANRDVSAARGLNPSDYNGHGAEGRTAWYVDEHCGDCTLIGPLGEGA